MSLHSEPLVQIWNNYTQMFPYYTNHIAPLNKMTTMNHNSGLMTLLFNEWQILLINCFEKQYILCYHHICLDAYLYVCLPTCLQFPVQITPPTVFIEFILNWNLSQPIPFKQRSGLKVIKLETILRLKMLRNDWLIADTCPQAANHCVLFLVWEWTQVL